MIKLTITEKGGEAKALSFDKDEVLIGRVSGNDIVLPKGNVSKRHSRLALRNGQVEISDLKSTNGTYVNGRKIGDPLVLSGSDRVYVGDFLITIEGLGAAAEGTSGARRVPPPPPPARGGSSAAQLPVEASEETNTGGEGGEDEEDAPLAVRPPRSSGRMPLPPPPPPPKRPPTPMSSPALEDEALEDRDMAAPPAPRAGDAADENTGSGGLFERRGPAPADDQGAFDGAGGRPIATGRRPGAALTPIAGAALEQEASVPGGATGEMVGASELDGLLADPAVLQVLITGPDSTYVDRGGTLAPLPSPLGDPNVVADAVWRIANTAVPPPPPENPVVDVRLPDGTRLAAVFPPAAPRGVVAAFRKPGLPERALADLCPSGAKDLETVLDAAVAARRNLLVTGDAMATGALVGALAGAIPADRRVVSVGGAPGRARAGWTELAPTADTPSLVRVAAAMHAEHLIYADAAGPEAIDLLLAAARGQDGLVVVLPARTAGEALARLEALIAPAYGVAGAGTAPLVASTIDLVVQVATGPDGAARVVEIAEPHMDGRQLGAHAVAVWRADGGRRGGAGGKLEVEGVSARLGAAFAGAGKELPSSLVRK